MFTYQICQNWVTSNRLVSAKEIKWPHGSRFHSGSRNHDIFSARTMFSLYVNTLLIRIVTVRKHAIRRASGNTDPGCVGKYCYSDLVWRVVQSSYLSNAIYFLIRYRGTKPCVCVCVCVSRELKYREALPKIV